MAAPKSSLSQNHMLASSSSSSSPSPAAAGEYLLQLLQKGHVSSSEVRNTDSILVKEHHRSLEEEEQYSRHVLQQDPAVAAMGPCHSHSFRRLSDDVIDGDRTGLLPVQDLQHGCGRVQYHQYEHHHQYEHRHQQHQHQHQHQQQHPHPHQQQQHQHQPQLQLHQHQHQQHHQGSLHFPGTPPSLFPELFTTSHMDPLLGRPPPTSTQNQFFAPYPYRPVDHHSYVQMPPPGFGQSGLMNSNSSFVHSGHNMVSVLSHTGVENPKQHDPFLNKQILSHKSVQDANPPVAAPERVLLQQGEQQFYTQFGSVGVKIAQKDCDKEETGMLLPSASFPRKPIKSDESMKLTSISKTSLAKGYGPIGPVRLEEEQTCQSIVGAPSNQLSHHQAKYHEKSFNLIESMAKLSKRPDLHAYEFSNLQKDALLLASDNLDSANFLNSSDSLDTSEKLQLKQRYRQIAQDGKTTTGNDLLNWTATTHGKRDEDKEGETMRFMGTQEELPIRANRDIPKQRGQSVSWRLKHSNSSEQSNDQVNHNSRLRNKSLIQDNHVGLPSDTRVNAAPDYAANKSKQALHTSLPVDDQGTVNEGNNDETILGCIEFLELCKDNVSEEHIQQAPPSKDLKQVRQSNSRVSMLPKFNRREFISRADSEKCSRQFLSIFQTLIPPVDEEIRRKKLLSTLKELVSGIWPDAQLYLFGSCANAFGVCNSDIDICLSIESEDSNKAKVVRKLADILEENDMQNVQALTHARVPIVKYSDPKTGISCDVCVNNMLAVVNTKLLRDYAQIDVRLRQLAFLVKHWAKCRQVNETYRGTLSSYAYVLMCIHFLQQRKPPVLPCLQKMEPTFQQTVGHIKCAYFDRVESLKGFGQKNKESLADLLTSFFEYWAFGHDYSHSVISIRTGRFLSKAEKDWTRRIGNERHLICIEDPFEISHDLGRVVDKYSIRALREEFQRAARIMRDTEPWVRLFKPFVRQQVEDDALENQTI